MKNQIDKLDKQILAALQADARKPVLEIARELGVTRATVHTRISRLKKKEIIRGSKIIIDMAALGYEISAFVGINLTGKAEHQEVIKALETFPEIVEILVTTGGYNMLVRVLVPDIRTLHDLLTNKMKMPGILSTETYMILDTHLVKDLNL